MKTIFYLVAILAITSCTKSSSEEAINRNCVEVEFDQPFQIQVGSTACLEDGRKLELISVEDQHCPCHVLCDWEGELVLKIEAEDINGTITELDIGSSKNIPHGDLFQDVTVSDVTYIYDGKEDSLPLCSGIFSQNEITIKLIISKI